MDETTPVNLTSHEADLLLGILNNPGVQAPVTEMHNLVALCAKLETALKPEPITVIPKAPSEA